MMFRNRRLHSLVFVACLLLLAAGIVLPALQSPPPYVTRDIVDSLQSPVEVRGWNSAGLLLADGRIVQLPGFRSLAAEIPYLNAFLHHGVEIAPNGDLYGLVKVHHWCGNDSVRLHLARVNLAEAMMYLRVGETSEPVAVTEYDLLKYRFEENGVVREAFVESRGSFRSWGWNVSEYSDFQSWQELKQLQRGVVQKQ